MQRSSLAMAGMAGLFLALCGCGGRTEDEAASEQPEATDGQAAVTCTPTNYTWQYFQTASTHMACVFGAFNTTCANQISVNIAEYPTWNGSYSRIQGSGYRPASATTGKLCAWACIANPSTSKYYKKDLWDLGGKKQSQNWVTAPLPITFNQSDTGSWPIYAAGSSHANCSPSPPIPN